MVGAGRAGADVDKTAERQEGATALGPWSSGKPEVPPPAALPHPACGARSRGPGEGEDALADEAGAHRCGRCSGGFGDDRWGC